MKMRKALTIGMCVVLATGWMAPPLHARPAKQELSWRETYSMEDAVRAQAHMDAAMTLPMEELVRAATLNNPEAMLRYGLALELGRTPASHLLSRGERDVLKQGYRAMTDLYLTSKDKFDIRFNEDAMLDQPEFWIYLAKHIGRKQQRQPQNMFMEAMGPSGTTETGAFFKVDEPEDKLNLNRDLVLRRHMVNAATSCASSARAFARMKKAQTVDLNEAKVPPESHEKIRSEAVMTYKTSYQQGVMACGSEAYFFKIADYAYANLGAYGQMKDDPSASLAALTE